MRSTRTPLIALFLSVAVAGTAWATVSTDWDRTFDFSTVKTYAWKSGTPAKNADGVTNDLMQRRLEEAVDQELTAAGWKKVDDDGDVLVTTHSSSKNDIDISSFGYAPIGWRWGGWGVGSISVDEFPVGAILVDVLATDGKSLLWRGSAHDIMISNNPDKNTKKIQKVVGKMFKVFPPGAVNK